MHRPELPVEQWGADAQLGAKVLPFVEQLAVGFGNLRHRPRPADSRGIKPVTPPSRFVRNGPKINGNRVERLWLRLEPDQLRMVPVAAGAPSQHLLRKQALPPSGDESSRVQIRRMQGPKPHARQFFGVAGVKNWNT